MEFFDLHIEGTWELNTLNAHSIGVNTVSWAPSVIPGSLFQPLAPITPLAERRFASGGCDNIIRIWKYVNYLNIREDAGNWKEEVVLQAHTDWVRDVAFAPNLGMGRTYLATCSQDKTVLVWTLDATADPTKWTKKQVGPTGGFTDVIWRVSWSLAGNLLAVACGDNKITLWKEGVDGEWALVGDVNQTEAPV
jgi:protein transport protein SEC13